MVTQGGGPRRRNLDFIPRLNVWGDLGNNQCLELTLGHKGTGNMDFLSKDLLAQGLRFFREEWGNSHAVSTCKSSGTSKFFSYASNHTPESPNGPNPEYMALSLVAAEF